jgi:hypothetical protein
VISLDNVPSDAPKFEDYPATLMPTAIPAPVDLSTGREARRWHTVLRQAESEGPDFAGHYKVARGCGSGCAGVAVIDARNGKVRFPVNLRTIQDYLSNGDRITFRTTSRLLVVVGLPNSDESKNGVAFYSGNGRTMNLVRAYSYENLCAARKRPSAR